jgi:hypothetical protein
MIVPNAVALRFDLREALFILAAYAKLLERS